jgi:signal transduction histidine kinase
LFFLQKLLLHFRRWRLEELSDMWRIVLWLEQERQAGRGEPAMDQYLQKLAPIISANIDRYAELIRALDGLTDGIYSKLDPQRNARIGLPPGVTMMVSFEKAYAELKPFLSKLMSLPAQQQAAEWRRLMENGDEYRVFVTRLVQQLGNFELVAMSLPGVGEITSDPRTQAILTEMYRINTRHIRLMDIGYSLLRAWHSQPAKASYAFFQTDSDIAKLVREMLFEYMVESDPERIALAQERAKKAGRRMQRYRFWRPAETFRQMAQVEYDAAARRRPRPTREYVSLNLPATTPAITVDIQRFEWAMKEVFNNCIAATTQMSVTRQGLVALPLEKQAANPNQPAIRISVKMISKRVGLFSRDFVQLVFEDQGVGMNPHQGALAHLWAYSTRRGGTEEKQAKGQLDQADHQELLIGGKGIGLPFARATVMEMGGTLDFQTTQAVGTVVTIELPLQSPLTV